MDIGNLLSLRHFQHLLPQEIAALHGLHKLLYRLRGQAHPPGNGFRRIIGFFLAIQVAQDLQTAGFAQRGKQAAVFVIFREMPRIPLRRLWQQQVEGKIFRQHPRATPSSRTNWERIQFSRPSSSHRLSR